MSTSRSVDRWRNWTGPTTTGHAAPSTSITVHWSPWGSSWFLPVGRGCHGTSSSGTMISQHCGWDYEEGRVTGAGLNVVGQRIIYYNRFWMTTVLEFVFIVWVKSFTTPGFETRFNFLIHYIVIFCFWALFLVKIPITMNHIFMFILKRLYIYSVFFSF